MADQKSGLQERHEHREHERVVQDSKRPGGQTSRVKDVLLREGLTYSNKNSRIDQTSAEEKRDDSEGFTKSKVQEEDDDMIIRFLMGNARSIGADIKIQQTETIAKATKSDVLVIWETGLRETNVVDIDEFNRVCHAAKPGTGPTTFAGVGMWIRKDSSIVIKNRKSIQKTHFQAICIETNYFSLIGFYRSPN